MDNQLDPQALALAKAIRRTETGGHKDPYNARGASGEFGAFQFMPATYKSLAQKHLGNPNAAPTVENQNKIVYSEIKKLKDQGYNPAQIASIWNSGKPDRYKTGGVGVNKYGVSYNVPQYVSKVSQNYKALIGTVQPVQQQVPEQPVEPTIEQQKQERIAQGLPVSVREDRAEPTFVGGIIRDIVKQPLKAALSVARPIVGYSKGVSVDTNYLGNVGDYGTEIQKDTQQLAQKYKQGDISLGRAAIGGIGAGAKQAMDLASIVPVGQVGSIAKGGIAAKTAIPTLKTAVKESLIRGGAIGAGYDVSGQLASGEQYKPMQTVGAAALGTAVDFGLTKALPEGVEFGKKKFSQSPEYVDARMNDIVEKKMKDIFDIENSYAKTRKAMDYAKDANANARRRVAETDVLVGSVDDTGTIRTKQPGGAVDKYTQQTIQGKESVVRDLLEREGASITPQDLQKKLISAIDNDRMLQGKARTKALNDVIDEVAAYPLNENGTIPLSSVHDAKIATTKIIKDFATPVEYKTYQKSLARGLKEAIEENSSEEIRKINNELAEYYKDIRLLESLDGKKVKGGKLGKYFSQISGNIIGGVAGSAVGGPVGSAVGTIVGGEVGGRIRGNTFTKTFGKLTGGKARGSNILTKATVKSKSPKLPLGLPSGRGPSENFSPPRLPAPKQNIFEPRAKVIGYSNSEGNLNQRYNSTATASKTGISKVSRETPKKSITKQVVKTEPKIVKSKTLPTKNGEAITQVGDKKFTVKSPERIYNKGTRIVGEYNGKEYITNSFILEFSNDANLVHDFPRTPKGPDSNDIQTLINKSKDGAKDIGKPVSMGDSGGGDKVFIFKDGTAVNPDYYNYVAKKYPNLKLEHNGTIGAIIVSSDDKMVGLLMPYNKIVENKNIVPIENVVKPTKRIISEESYRKALKNLGDTSTLNSTPIHLSKDALIVAGYHIENGVRSAAELGIELAKKGYKFTKEQLEELFNKANKNVEIEPLIQEAKKYKSAEEFVKAQGTLVYHGTNKNFDVFDVSKKGSTQGFDEPGIFFTSDKNVAKTYNADYVPKPKYKLTPIEAVKNDNLQIKEVVVRESDFKDLIQQLDEAYVYDEIKTKPDFDGVRPSTFFDMNREAIKELLKARPELKGLKVTAEGQTVYMVTDANLIKTKSQLTDIWNKANK